MRPLPQRFAALGEEAMSGPESGSKRVFIALLESTSRRSEAEEYCVEVAVSEHCRMSGRSTKMKCCIE